VQDLPQGLRVTDVPDGRTVRLDPFLVEHGRRDVQIAVGALSLAAVLWKAASGLVALLVLMLAAARIAWTWVRDARRSARKLEVHLGRDDVRLAWDGREAERVLLRDVGRVDVQEAGYQRWHAVAQVAGREPLRIPMERESEAAVAWMAETLAAAGRTARARDGA
jgi:hypothetical protein